MVDLFTTDKQFLNVDEVMELFPVSRNTVYDWVSRRRVESLKIGGTIRISTRCLRQQVEKMQRAERVANNERIRLEAIKNAPPVKAIYPKGVIGVYFIQCREFVKIGSSVDCYDRLTNFATGVPFQIRMRAVFKTAELKTARTLEREFHKQFASLRVRGEWFKAIEPLMSFIKRVDAGMVE